MSKPLKSNNNTAIATHHRSGCLRSSTYEWDENQALFTATEWPGLYMGFLCDPYCSQQPIRKHLPGLELRTFTEPITWQNSGPHKTSSFLTPLLTWTDIRHEPRKGRISLQSWQLQGYSVGDWGVCRIFKMGGYTGNKVRNIYTKPLKIGRVWFKALYGIFFESL